MSVQETALDNIAAMCKIYPGLAKNIEQLDQYDFSEFLTDGRSLSNIVDAIEDKYDLIFKEKYGHYTFHWLDMHDINNYLTSRYDVWFQEYTDWVVRKENGAHSKARKRSEDSD